jgi:hypothetical protein
MCKKRGANPSHRYFSLPAKEPPLPAFSFGKGEKKEIKEGHLLYLWSIGL